MFDTQIVSDVVAGVEGDETFDFHGVQAHVFEVDEDLLESFQQMAGSDDGLPPLGSLLLYWEEKGFCHAYLVDRRALKLLKGTR